MQPVCDGLILVLAAGVPGYIGPGAGITVLSSFFVLLGAFGLLLLSLLTWPVRILLLAFRRWRVVDPLVTRVVVVGLDGLDPGRVRRLMEAGRLPHLHDLAVEGSFTELRTTLPPISPVAWSSFQTGVNPGKHNIFDFLNRDLRTYLPELSSTRIAEGTSRGWRAKLGFGGGTIRLLRKSRPFWSILGEHGVFSTILRVPITFPPERFFGLSLSAMCTPDLRGTQGSFTLFTTDPQALEETTGGLVLPVQRQGNRLEGVLPGPPTAPGVEQGTRFTVHVARSGTTARLKIGGETIALTPGVESDWVRVPFGSWGGRAWGLCRFRLISLTPEFRLYVSPIHLDPERPAMPLSHPLSYALYLSKLHGPFATLGLAEDTWALNAGVTTEAEFLEQAWAIHDERERMFFDALRRMPRGLTVCVFDGPDRIQHMFSRHDDPSHPANVGRDTTAHAGVLDQMYERMDDLVGRVAAELGPRDLLIVLSDHGFCQFSRGVNLNVWLREQGYLVYHEDHPPGDYLAGVDWSQTRAYAFGLSGIYLNLADRESRGIVPAKEAAALRREIAEKLTGLIDPERQARAIRKVYDSQIAYRGPYAGNGPDLVIGYERGWRASWGNAVGRGDEPLFQDNTRLWSGDHCVDPVLVPGVLFCNHRLAGEEPRSILDLAPTILRLFGVPVPAYMDGRAWTWTDLPSKSVPMSQPHPVSHPHKEGAAV